MRGSSVGWKGVGIDGGGRRGRCWKGWFRNGGLSGGGCGGVSFFEVFAGGDFGGGGRLGRFTFDVDFAVNGGAGLVDLTVVRAKFEGALCVGGFTTGSEGEGVGIILFDGDGEGAWCFVVFGHGEWR